MLWQQKQQGNSFKTRVLIYGKQPILEALKNSQVKRLMLAQGLQKGTAHNLEGLAHQQGVIVEYLPRIELDRALKTTHHQGIVAEIPELKYSEPEAAFNLAANRKETLLLILLDQITDAHNYGAIIRSAEVLGAHGVITEQRRSTSLSPIVAKVSAGAAMHLPLIQVKNLPRYMEELKKQGVWLYGTTTTSDTTVTNEPKDIDWDRPVGLVIGSEGTGMRRLVGEKCDELVHLPIKGKVKSLNASVATGILLHEVVSRRKA